VIFVAFWRLNYTQMLSCITHRIGVLNHTAFFYYFIIFIYFKQELCFVAYYDKNKITNYSKKHLSVILFFHSSI
jgi:hypothetical protein